MFSDSLRVSLIRWASHETIDAFLRELPRFFLYSVFQLPSGIASWISRQLDHRV